MDKAVDTGRMEEPVDLKDWYVRQFVPWKEAMRTYQNSEAERQAKWQRHVGQLQTIVAMLMDGKTRQALMAWNTLQLHPTLDGLELGSDGDSLVLIERGGHRTVLMMDDVISELEGLLRERSVPEQDEA